jgi:hypothetical protein
MTPQQVQIVGYIRAHPRLGPHVTAAADGSLWPPPILPQLPSAEEFAAELLADAAFRTLQPGTWLSTTDGQLIAEAVSRVIPPSYEPVYTLTVEALRLAAAQQTGRGRQRAGALALAILGAGILVAIQRES